MPEHSPRFFFEHVPAKGNSAALNVHCLRCKRPTGVSRGAYEGNNQVFFTCQQEYVSDLLALNSPEKRRVCG